MPIVFPLDLPTAPGVRDVEWDPITVVGSTSSRFTGKQQIFEWPGQWWSAHFNVPPMKEPNAGIWEAFMLSLNGMRGTFKFGDPSRKTTRGTQAGSLQVNAGCTANTNRLPVQFGTGGSGILVIGDWIQIGTYLHRILKVPGAPDSGTYDIWPRTRLAYAAGTEIIYTNPVGIFRLANNSMKWNTDVAKVHSMQFSIVEDV